MAGWRVIPPELGVGLRNSPGQTHRSAPTGDDSSLSSHLEFYSFHKERPLNNNLFQIMPRKSVKVHPLPPNVHIMSFLRRQESTGATTHCSTSGYQVDGFLPSYPTKPQAVWRGPGRRNDDTQSREVNPNTRYV